MRSSLQTHISTHHIWRCQVGWIYPRSKGETLLAKREGLKEKMHIATESLS